MKFFQNGGIPSASETALLIICVLIGTVVNGVTSVADEKTEVQQVYRQFNISVPDTLGGKQGVEILAPWIEAYREADDDFEKRNRIAFQLTLYTESWLRWISYMAIDPTTPQESQTALVHFTSALYTHLYGADHARCELASGRDVWQILGYLQLLRTARTLRSDMSDHTWPQSGVLGPKELPQYIARVLKDYPELCLQVAQTLQVYGPLAKKEARDLLPLLLSDDVDVVAAARSAIGRMDPEGLCTMFHLDGTVPLTAAQLESVRDFLRQPQAEDKRQSDGSPQSETSKKFEELWRYFHKSRTFEADLYMIDEDFWPSTGSDPGEQFTADRELALQFKREKTSANWWRILSLAMYSPDFHDLSPEMYQCDRLPITRMISIFASALYDDPREQTELFDLFEDEDPLVVERAMFLSLQLLPFKSVTDKASGHADQEGMPARFTLVLEQHPRLIGAVATCLSDYGSHAAAQSEVLVPHLLSNDPRLVNLIKRTITKINLELAMHLDIVEEMGPLSGFNKYPLLTPGQRERVEAYLKDGN